MSNLTVAETKALLAALHEWSPVDPETMKEMARRILALEEPPAHE